MANEVTAKTNELVKDWIYASERLRRAKAEVNSAECELMNKANELGRWLCPTDAKQNEPFNIWFGDGVLSASYVGMSNYSVLWRKEPGDKQKSDLGMYG
jgi:hypothetical protein